MNPKLVPAVLLLVVVMAAGIGQSFRSADAAVSGPLVASATSITSGSNPVTITVPIGAPVDDDITISISGFSANVSGALVVTACNPGCNDELGKGTTANATPIVIQTNGLSHIILSLALTCTSNGSVTITAVPSDIDRSTTVNCVVPTNGGSGGGGGNGDGPGGSVELIPGVGQFTLSANPNLLPCEGGTSTITGNLIEAFGISLDKVEVHFVTSAGTITKTSNNTAKLTLGPNQTSAIVTGSLYYEVDDRNGTATATVRVSLACNGGATLVVTASPNVIDCTGTTTLTASVRDSNGHVIPGRGFHFVTNTGLLTVNPNNANTDAGIATLSLRPGDGDATVIVSSGAMYGTYEELAAEGNFTDWREGNLRFVTVQQNCLSTPTGMIKVNASQKNVVCGQSVFIGLSVVDVDIQTVENDTAMTLISTAGGFYGGEGVLLSAAQVPTRRGEANVIYYAPANFNGEVKITAASGDTYGFQTLNITCVGAPNTGTGSVATTGGGGGGVSAAPVQPCVSIGDGMFINPNTGATCNPNQIRPPNTGSAGLK